MSLFDKVRNFFGKEEGDTVIVAGAEPGDVIPIDSPTDTIILLPCPLQIRLMRACICMTCDFIMKNCPMEIACRNVGCEAAFIKGCTNYTNQEEGNCDEKRKIFRYGSAFDGGIFRFDKGSKGNSELGGQYL